ncbi:hypothetical protein ASG40_13160 [Methylobacterium sp. Leaf399]|nr:hypothetical protein ASG40_13160 [Methylobacterium sp. Leaf399]
MNVFDGFADSGPDEPRRLANVANHGFDFAEFEIAFGIDRFLTRPARPSRNGRRRFLLIGLWKAEVVVAAVISPLGSEAISLVSVRRASITERAAYDQA